MDGATRMILAHRISKKKAGVNPRPLFRDAVSFARRMPHILVSNGLEGFIKAADNVFAESKRGVFIHIREIHLKLQFDNNNNKQERLNGEVENRLKVIRGLKSEHPGIIQLLIVYHNFFRPHLSLNSKTPAMEAGVTIEGEREYDWNNRIAIIQNSAIHTGQ